MFNQKSNIIKYIDVSRTLFYSRPVLIRELGHGKFVEIGKKISSFIQRSRRYSVHLWQSLAFNLIVQLCSKLSFNEVLLRVEIFQIEI